MTEQELVMGAKSNSKKAEDLTELKDQLDFKKKKQTQALKEC